MGLLMGKVNFLDKDSGEEVKAFINNLSNNHHVSSSTQNQALQGILFLYTISLFYFKDLLLNRLENNLFVTNMECIYAAARIYTFN